MKVSKAVASQEQYLSRLADEREAKQAAARGLTVAELKEYQRRCKHIWIAKLLYDECSLCDAARA